jgi:GT2 family glycosyltransferase
MMTSNTANSIDNNVLFSVIIPTYKRNSDLMECLGCLQSYFTDSSDDEMRNNMEVIVSDDAGDIELRRLIEQRYPWCRYEIGPARGPAANRNHGASRAMGEWIVFTDDDCLPQPGWLNAYAELESQYDVMEGRTTAEGIRRRIDEECPTNETGGYLWSCNFAIRRNAFNDLRGFNEGFPAAAMEDVELRKRIDKSQYRVVYVPRAIVHHPWRTRKGISFLKAKAKSIAICVNLHPEMENDFSLQKVFKKTLITLKTSLVYCIRNKTISGISRQLYLDIYLSASTWREVRKMKSSQVSQGELLGLRD